MYLEIFLADFAVFRVFGGISRDFAEMPEFRGSVTVRNIRSPDIHFQWTFSTWKQEKSCSPGTTNIFVPQARIELTPLQILHVYRTDSDGSNKKFASGIKRYIFSFYSRDKKFIKVNVTNVLLFTSISYERKHVSDLSMLVFCFCGHTFVVYLRTTKVHNNSVFQELTLHFLLQKSHLWNSPIPSDFKS